MQSRERTPYGYQRRWLLIGVFGKEIREAYPNNLLNLNDLKLSDVTKVLARRNERIFWINLSDRNKDKIWFRELLKQKRNRSLAVVFDAVIMVKTDFVNRTRQSLLITI